MTKAIVEVDLPAYLGDRTIEEVVVEMAARELVKDLVKTEWHQKVKAIAQENLERAIANKLEPIVVTAMTRSFQETRFGEPVGEPKTLSEVVMDVALRALGQQKEHAFPNRGVGNMVERIVKEQLDKLFRKELKSVMEAASKSAQKAITEEAASILGEAIRKAGARL